MTEAIPLAVTAMLGPALCVLLGIGPAKETFRAFADPIIFLFLGSFLIAEAMLRHGLNRRIAFGIMRRVGTSPARLLVGFGLASGLVSSWVSNTATTAMMFPIALAVLKERQSPPIAAIIRDRVDADDGIRGVDRRVGNACGDAAKPDRAWSHRV
jgi:sodium-dependent dicarboxylate transporter 2/3/5